MGNRILAAWILEEIFLGMENSDVADFIASSTIFPLSKWLLFFDEANNKDVLSASYICIYMYVCMYVCMYLKSDYNFFLHVCMYVCMYVAHTELCSTIRRKYA